MVRHDHVPANQPLIREIPRIKQTLMDHLIRQDRFAAFRANRQKNNGRCVSSLSWNKVNRLSSLRQRHGPKQNTVEKN